MHPQLPIILALFLVRTNGLCVLSCIVRRLGLLAPMPGMVAPGMGGMGGMGMMIPGHPHMLPMMQPRFR